MRVAILSELLPDQRGGLLNHALSLGRGLASRGHAVTLVGRRRRTAIAPVQGLPFEPMLPERERGWKERRLGVIVMERRRWEARRTRAAMRLLLRRHDIVHYHGHHVPAVRGLPSRVVLTAHDYAGVCPKKTLFRSGDSCDTTDERACGPCYFDDEAARRADVSAWQVRRWRRAVADALGGRAAVFVSAAQRALWERYLGVSLARSLVIPNFVETESLAGVAALPRARIRQELGLPHKARIVLLASSPAPYKGVSEFLAAWAPRSAGALTLVAGADPEEKTPSPGVVRLGWLPRERTLKYMRAADAFVLPSLLPEPSPTTVLEAVSVGTPVVAMDRGGIREIAGRAEGWVAIEPSMAGLRDRVDRVLASGPPTVPPPAGFGSGDAIRQIEQLYESALAEQEGNSA